MTTQDKINYLKQHAPDAIATRIKSVRAEWAQKLTQATGTTPAEMAGHRPTELMLLVSLHDNFSQVPDFGVTVAHAVDELYTIIAEVGDENNSMPF